MRFAREEKIGFSWSQRKTAALLRKQHLEREAMPLFRKDVAATQKPVDQVRAERERNWNESTFRWRNQTAAAWRFRRRALRALPREEQLKCLAEWNAAKSPASHEYFGNMVWLVYRRLGLVEPGSADFMADWVAAVEKREASARSALVILVAQAGRVT